MMIFAGAISDVIVFTEYKENSQGLRLRYFTVTSLFLIL